MLLSWSCCESDSWVLCRYVFMEQYLCGNKVNKCLIWFNVMTAVLDIGSLETDL